MDAAAALLVIVVSSRPDDPMAGALERAALQTLGADAHVELVRVERLPSEADAARMGVDKHAASVAEVGWRDEAHRHAWLHVLPAPGGAWIDREIGFSASDAPAEQGRTVGFALASMLPEPVAPPASSTPPIVPVAPPPPPPPPRIWHGAIEADGVLGAAVGGYGGGLGGGVAGEWYFSSSFGFRFGGTLRSSVVGPASATVLMGSFGPGLAWRMPLPWRLAVGARVDVLLMREAVSHFDGDEPTQVQQERWLPAVDGVVEGAWYFEDGAALVVAGGLEGATGSTDVYVQDKVVASLPPWRGLLETGIRARF